MSIIVNMAEMQIAHAPAELMCLGVGSCIALTLYDAKNKIGGLAHIVLPRAENHNVPSHPGKFADTAVKELLNQMKAMGTQHQDIRAKVFGGANMFSSLINSPPIGESNAKAVLEELAENNLIILVKDIGGTIGRSILFDINTGQVKVKTRLQRKGIIY